MNNNRAEVAEVQVYQVPISRNHDDVINDWSCKVQIDCMDKGNSGIFVPAGSSFESHDPLIFPYLSGRSSLPTAQTINLR